MMKHGARAFNIASLLVGLTLFIFLIRQAGFEDILARTRSLGAGFLLLIALAGLRTIFRAYAWMRCMTPEERETGFLNIWRARLIGDTAGNLTTAGPIVAEPVRLKALDSAQPLSSRVLSLSIETLTYLISNGLVIIAGLTLLLAQFSLNSRLTAAGRLAILLIAATVALTVIIVRQRWAVLSHGIRKLVEWIAATDIGPLNNFISKFEDRLDQLHSMEKRLHDFYIDRKRDFVIVACCELLFHVFAFAETYFTLQMIGAQASMSSAFALEATNRVISIAFSFVPARLGVDEAGSGWLAETLGLGAAAGVTLAIIRKARVIFWSAVGLALFALSKYHSRRATTEG